MAKRKVKVVAATGVSANSLGTGGRVLASEIEKAMVEAAAKAAKDGISDPEKVRELMLAARDKVRG